MLVGIRQRSATPPLGDDPVGRLLACHGRIRSFTALAGRLAEAQGAEPTEIAEAAANVHRYFTVALPLHVADEETSLAPRLLAARPALRTALDEMAAQHQAIEAVLVGLVSRWAALAGEPQRLPALASALADGAARLGKLWDAHLALEEGTLFPAAGAALPAEERDAVRREMQARRAG